MRIWKSNRALAGRNGCAILNDTLALHKTKAKQAKINGSEQKASTMAEGKEGTSLLMDQTFDLFFLSESEYCKISILGIGIYVGSLRSLFL